MNSKSYLPYAFLQFVCGTDVTISHAIVKCTDNQHQPRRYNRIHIL